MSRIGDIEDALLVRVRECFGATLRDVSSIPASWDDQMVSRYLVNTPGVLLSWGIDRADGTNSYTAEVNALWQFTVATSHEGKELPRRRGDARALGAYDIVERLIPLMHGFEVPNEGELRFVSADNLFSAANERKGLTVYAVVFEMRMSFPSTGPEAGDLDDFLTFHADYDLAPGDGQPDAADTVTLPAASP